MTGNHLLQTVAVDISLELPVRSGHWFVCKDLCADFLYCDQQRVIAYVRAYVEEVIRPEAPDERPEKIGLNRLVSIGLQISRCGLSCPFESAFGSIAEHVVMPL